MPSLIDQLKDIEGLDVIDKITQGDKMISVEVLPD